MTDSPVSAVTRQARQTSFGEVTLTQWAQASAALATALKKGGVLDPEVGAIAKLAHALAKPEPELPLSPLAGAFQLQGTQKMTQMDHLEARSALAIVTQSAARSASGREAVAMRSLVPGLGEPPRESAHMEVALRQWRDVVMLAGDLSLRERTVVATTHYQMMVVAEQALERVELSGSGPVDRLMELTKASQVWWLETARNLANQGLGEVVEHSDGLAAISVASVDLCREFASPASPHLIASAMLYTGFGGGSVVADSVAPTSCWPKPTPYGEDGIRAVPARLEQVSAMVMAAGVRLRDRAHVRDNSPQHVASPGRVRSNPQTETPTAGDRLTRRTASPSSEPLWASKEPMSRADCEKAARRRDAGVLARAALEGRADARRLTAGVSEDELRALVRVGDQARADLMASVWKRLNFEKKGAFTRHEGEERMGHATLRLAEAVDRWDPKRGAWSTLAFAAIRYARLETMRDRINRKERERSYSLSEGLDLHVVDQAHQRAALQGLEDPVAVAAEKNVAAAQARRLIGRLPELDQRLVMGYLGLDDGRPKRLSQLAAEEEISARTVRRRVDHAVGRLTFWMNNGPRQANPVEGATSQVRQNDRHAQVYRALPSRGPSR